MSLEVFGGGDDEDLGDLAGKYGYALCDDGLWRETPDDKGFTDEQMWQYIEDRRDSDIESMLDYEASR